jgi:putative toxin-antitoxin system antitoxin component (TIGR02293 family)
MNKYQNFEEEIGQELNSILKQPGAPYYRTERSQHITINEFLSNKMMIINTIRAGIPYSFFKLIQNYTPFTETEWADYLDISTKSLQRYKASENHHFKPIHSEKIIEMAEVTNAGLEVFGSPDKLKSWLNTPNFALGNLKPSELLKDSYGKDMVMGELVRISHGIFV